MSSFINGRYFREGFYKNSAKITYNSKMIGAGRKLELIVYKTG